ncbi:hypothetical protein V8D89_006776 [Ganoderma adspersum]
MNGTAPPTAAPSSTAEQAAALNGAMDFLLLTAICTGVLIPVSVALFFSFSRIWRTPVFVLNVFVVALGFAYGGLTLNYLRSVFSGEFPSSRLTLVFMSMSFLVPVCVQSVLIIRVVAVYPPRMLSWTRCMLIYGTFAALSVARIVNMTLYLDKVSKEISRTNADTLTISAYAFSIPNGKIEWILQMVNDLYASTLFLLRLNGAQAFRSKKGGLASVFTNGGRDSYAGRLKALFWIAVFNFVFPVVLNIVIVAFAFRELNVLHIDDVITLNIFVEILCVLLATICCTGTYWGSAVSSSSMASDRVLARQPGAETTESLASAKFAPGSLGESNFAESDLEMIRVSR